MKKMLYKIIKIEFFKIKTLINSIEIMNEKGNIYVLILVLKAIENWDYYNQRYIKFHLAKNIILIILTYLVFDKLELLDCLGDIINLIDLGGQYEL